jgi:hypothetical protein
MNRPTLEVADIIRAQGKRFLKRRRSSLTWAQIKVLRAIERCRTATLGGHRDRCVRCGLRVASYNSCRNRHCPKCQSSARDHWLAKTTKDLLPVRYCHVVFTLPHQLAPLVYQNKRILYRLLFRASAATLLEVAADPRHLGAEIGFLSVLHTWGQNLQHHPHLHCVIPSGGLSPDHRRWIRSRDRFFLPAKVLSRVFRGKFVAGLRRAFREGKLGFYGDQQALQNPKLFRALVRSLFRQDWFVYAKSPFGGPQYVLHYLARYTHRVAISNHRLVRFQEGTVTFRWKDYAHGNQKRIMTLTADGAHPLVRLPGKPASRRPGAHLPATAPCTAAFVFSWSACNPFALHLVLSGLWGSHDRHREAHCQADPASVSWPVEFC